jgi:hypothetical protein
VTVRSGKIDDSRSLKGILKVLLSKTGLKKFKKKTGLESKKLYKT